MLHEVSFQSFNERDKVMGWIYVPAAKPKGIVQVVHGFGEHSRRYLHMIVAFMDAGYIVAADDHVGHGKTALENDTWGNWGNKGFHTMMEDEHKLYELVTEKYPKLPYYMFGHSMGSFIVRDYIAKYGSELAGVTICGTTGTFRHAKETKELLEQAISDGKGGDADAEYAGRLMGWMCERCDDVTIGNEWICSDPYVQRDHAEDPFDAFTRPTNNRAVLYFIQMMEEIKGTEWAEKVPTDLPIYNIGGDQDPVGEYGKGIYEVSNWLCDTGHNVKTKVYSGYRHEIHNYSEIKVEVEQGIIAFMDEN
ncbi:alpha/beta fold hydrolase [Hespellia stercorisuis]|uniref:Lysophospholipase, alpha-beta hydrolase superfamily n=1 Tax=Hespellia stercorisuis DSM 15480 TaxID=1121950 RepID=A0A1M6WD22_9FIRM|nr:alpha/beta fold hydrolase [Hespellia stercorisuis]SHK91548.1 Lysophospholipase, alpha-beta hydrolase superfamily [Hespellia stercorisuis DSM 15480]